MDKGLFEQLADLAESFARIGIKPVICGGLGIYLCFQESEGQGREMIRATSDVDLMLTESQVLEEAKRQAIAEIITAELKYVIREGREHLHFEKDNGRYLDILAPRIKGFDTQNFRIKFVKSKLHGHITDEACFIEEDLRTVSLRQLLPEDERSSGLHVQVPSPTNALILKLFAFDDRYEKQDRDRSQAHAWDVYVVTMLTGRSDYLEGREFLSRHRDSAVILKTRSIVDSKFSSVDKPGWQRVLETSGFHPGMSVQQKRERLDEAKRRLVRWFAI